MRSSLICLMSSLVLFAFSAPAAEEIEVCGSLAQGELLVVYPKKEATRLVFGGEDIALNGKKAVLLALSRDEAPKASFSVFYPSDFGTKYVFDVTKTAWNIQSIKGVAQSKVTPAKTDEAEILREQKDVKNALLKQVAQTAEWQKGFMLPVAGTVSGEFGNQRIFNGVPKSPHTGVDIAAPEGTKVQAAGDGVVLLAGGNYFYSGNMVILDHGDGLKTIYAHLKDTSVQVGQQVQQGDVIGHVGHTGRATGPHLHFGATVYQTRFRPQALLELNNQKCQNLEGVGVGE